MKTISVRLLQSSNALFPMLVTPAEIVTLVRLLQLKNVNSPMLVTPAGIVTLVRLMQPAKGASRLTKNKFSIPVLISFRTADGYHPARAGFVLKFLKAFHQESWQIFFR